MTAKVSGSLGRPYAVEVEWPNGLDEDILGTCSCPYYEGGLLCKHIWATLLKIDQDRLVAGTALTSAGMVHEHGDDWDDDDWEEVTPKRSPQRTPPSAAWKNQLQNIARYTIAQPTGESIAKKSGAKRREAWFVLNVSESLRREQLIVDFRQRETKQDGEFGKLKKLGVSNQKIPEFTDEEDGRLVELLLGNESIEDSYDNYYSQHYSSATSRAAIAPAFYDTLLPRMCATGRFVWQLDSSMPAEEGQAFTWDEGETWRFRLRAEDDPGQECWRFTGDVCRGTERIPLDDLVLLMATGLMLRQDQLARLDLEGGGFGWIATLRAQGSIEVPYSDREQLLGALYGLPQVPEVDLPPNLQVEQVREAPQGRLEIESMRGYSSGSKLAGNVGFVYGDHRMKISDKTTGLFDSQNNQVLVRDRPRETELIGELSALAIQWTRETPGYGYRPEHDLSFHKKHLPEIVGQLTELGWIVETEGVRIRQPGVMNLSVTSDVDWFELDGQVDFNGVSASLPDLLKAVRNKDQYIRLDDGSQGMLPEAWLKKYGHLAEMAEGTGESLRFAPSQTLLLDALLSEQDEVRVDRQFSAYRKKLRSFDGVKPCNEPRGFRGELRDYQKEGLGWLHFLRELRFGGCLADDMGLGKTVQVLALLQSRRLQRPKKGESRKPSIIVVPKSLVFNWINEASQFTPNLRMLNYTGIDRKSRMEEFGEFDALITTYGTLRRDIATFKETGFDYAILDESQAIKNHNSQASKAARLIKAEHRLAMTGTPVENHLGELWSLFEYLNPGMLGRSTAFNRFTKSGKDSGEAIQDLAQALRPFMLRRTKEQVLTELPKKTEQTLYCDMSPKQRKEYNGLRDYYRANLSNRVKKEGLGKTKIHVLEALLRLRQAACHPGLLDKKKSKDPSPKLETLLEQIREVVAEGHKALVFSQFTSLLSIVRSHLDQEKITYEYLDGRTRKRGDKVERFQTDKDCPLFLISLKAGGHGLNLTAADYVFILDPWWNPAAEAQAIDRAHRIGQTRPVFAYRIICRDTVEDKILELQATKRGLADAIVSADSSLIRGLTADDLQLLLS